MKRYIAFFSSLNQFPSIGEIIPNEFDFEDIDSAFMAIGRYKYDPDFPKSESDLPSDFVFDTQNKILHYMASNGEHEDALARPEYIHKLIVDIQDIELNNL